MGFSVNQRNSLRSPHVRGKDTRRQRDDSVRGIAPAYAGKSARAPARRSRTADHPRVCWDKAGTDERRFKEAGSPPRMRGKEQGGRASYGGAGITPACAGKRLTQDSIWNWYEGSPPRVRGKVRVAADLCQPPRITPACAGKRSGQSGKIFACEDHPRVCGEKVDAWTL